MRSRGIFDFDRNSERLTEVVALLEDPAVWNDAKRAQDLGRERRNLEAVVDGLRKIEQEIGDARDLLELASDETDEAMQLIQERGALIADRLVPILL